MEKANRIDASALIEAVNKIAEPTVEFEWNGMGVVVNRVLPMEAMMEFVDYVTKTCFGDDGEYLPEVKDFAIKSCLLEMYANFNLPEDLPTRYAVIYNSDIVDAVLNHIEGRQFGEIINAIEHKVSNIAQANIQAVMAQMQHINDECENLVNQIAGIYAGVNPNDLSALIHAMSDGNIDEGKVVQAYMDESKDSKVVQMPTGDK